MGGACTPFSQVVVVVVVVVFVRVVVITICPRIHPGEATVRITERFDVQEVNIQLTIFNHLHSTILRYFDKQTLGCATLRWFAIDQVLLEGVLLSSLTVREVGMSNQRDYF